MDLRDPIFVFREEAERKFWQGVDEHRGGDATRPFNGDLLSEFENECLDQYNYAVELTAEGVFTNEVLREVEKHAFNLWFLARSLQKA